MFESGGATAAIARLQSDDKSGLRRETWIHYLGDISVENYEQCFTETSRRIIEVGPPTTVSAAHTVPVDVANTVEAASRNGFSANSESRDVEDQVDE